MVEYKCSRCNKVFDKKHAYEVHINRKYKCKSDSDENDETKLKCKYCLTTFTTQRALDSHMINKCRALLKKEEHICEKCNVNFNNKTTLDKHINIGCNYINIKNIH